ncbi:MAG TPA: hypothetical protein VKB76_00765, partial [Ktedonobacterales bacterium]|nr:hypothetical protein [Ktedonobacterales bacterium]
LAIISEITISIAGRRAKAFRALLYQAEQARAVGKKRDRELWDVEIKKLRDQVKANVWMMRGAIVLSLYAGASYLIDSIGLTGHQHTDRLATGISVLSAVAIVGYVLWLVVYHGVQTDEIPEDGTSETAARIQDQLNLMRIEEMARLRDDLASRSLDVGARLALIASGLPITGQRLVMPTIKLLLGRGEDDGDGVDELAGWWNMRTLALACGEDFTSGRKPDDITRKYRRRCSDNAEKYRDTIRMHPMLGWVVEPQFAKEFWNIPDDLFNRMFADANGAENGSPPDIDAP